MKLLAAIALVLACSPCTLRAQSLEQVDQLAHANKALDLINQMQGMLDEQAHETEFSCLKAFGNQVFCKCVSANLPMSFTFSDYVSIVTQSKEQNGYAQLTSDVQKAYDAVPAVREKCVANVASEP